MHVFEGMLTLSGESTSGQFDEVKNTFRYTSTKDSTRKHLPEFEFEYIQTGTHNFPLMRGSIPSEHPEWEYIFEPGRVWKEQADGDYSRVALPVALQQKNANCVHNGVMTFLFNDDGNVSGLVYQLSNETCLHFKFDIRGRLSVSYSPYSIGQDSLKIADFQAKVDKFQHSHKGALHSLSGAAIRAQYGVKHLAKDSPFPTVFSLSCTREAHTKRSMGFIEVPLSSLERPQLIFDYIA